MYKVLFWDFDGTLVDTGEGVINCIEYALNKMGVTPPERSKMFKYMGPPLIESFADFFDNEEDIRKAVEYYRERYSDVGWAECTPFKGIPEVLKELRELGYINGMATSKPEHYAHKIAKHLGFFDLLDYPCGATTDGRRTHKNEVVKYALETTGVRLGPDGKVLDDTEVLMIGDRFYDVEGAGELGVKTLGVSFGFGSREELLTAGAIDVVDSPEEIVRYLKEHR